MKHRGSALIFPLTFPRQKVSRQLHAPCRPNEPLLEEGVVEPNPAEGNRVSHLRM